MQDFNNQPSSRLFWLVFYLPLIVVVGELITIITILAKGAESLVSSKALVTFSVLVVLLIIAAITIIVLFYTSKKKNLELEKTTDTQVKEIEELKMKLTQADGYKKSFKLLGDGFRKVHKVTAEGPHDIEAYNTAMSIFCTNLAKVFHDITGRKYSVCIKLLADEVDKVDYKSLCVTTFCRDIHSDDRNEGDDMEHLVSESMAFDTILKHINRSKGRSFCKNRLPYVPGYYNSSFKKYEGYSTAAPFHQHMSGDQKNEIWPLKYKSVLIVPICPGDDKDRTPDRVYGFLCIDTLEMDSFDEPIDAILMMGCGDGLFYCTRKIKGLLNELKQKQPNGKHVGESQGGQSNS